MIATAAATAAVTAADGEVVVADALKVSHACCMGLEQMVGVSSCAAPVQQGAVA